jgi:hypothetical protein
MPAPVQALRRTGRSGGHIAVVRGITVPGRSSCIVQASQDLPLTYYGDGAQTRSFCSGDNLIAPIVRLMAAARRPMAVRTCGTSRLSPARGGLMSLNPVSVPLPGSANGLHALLLTA